MKALHRKSGGLNIRGASIVELAFLLPLIITILVIGVDFARVMHARTSLLSAVRSATLAGFQDFLVNETPYTGNNSNDNEKINVNPDILEKIKTAFDEDIREQYILIDDGKSSGFLCQCASLGNEDLENFKNRVECNDANFVGNCPLDRVRIYLTMSAEMDFNLLIKYHPVPNIHLGPYVSELRVK